MSMTNSEIPNEYLIPEPLFVSGRPAKSLRPKAARPKQLSQYVFPHFGMIMFDLFWVKYALFLRLRGHYDLNKQKYLFFWAERNGHINPRHGVLYYSLISCCKAISGLSPDVSVGSIWASGWLFKKGWRKKIIEKLTELTQNPDSFDFGKFVDHVFSSDFKSDCKRKGIDLAGVMNVEMSGHDYSNSVKKKGRGVAETIGDFVDALSHLLNSHRELCKAGSVVEPNIDFAQNILLQKLEEPTRVKDLKKLANTDFVFKSEESEIFLKILQATDKGIYFARSLFLLFYFDPLNHGKGYLREQLRNASKIYRKTKDVRKRIQSEFGHLVSPSTLDGLGETCFYWEVNFFLADIENAARGLLEKHPDRVSVDEVDLYFSRIKSDPITEFTEKLEGGKREKLLKTLIHMLNEDDERITATFFFKLLDTKVKRKSSKLILNLMVELGTLEKETERLYSVAGPLPEDWSSAFFYGIDPLIDWARTILRGLRHGK